MRVLVGMSGYAYKEWKGGFYPPDLPADQMLAYYTSRFSTVEINNTFYRLPKESVIVNWAAQAPEGFVFVLKASQRITHIGRLKDTEDAVGFFLKSASALGAKLGPTLFQLPPNFKKDLPRLQEFLKRIPPRWRAAFEFRHPTWFDEEVYDALRARQAALVAAETDEGEAPPVVPTADWGYLRLRCAAYARQDLERWAQRIREQPWKEAFVFFKHEDDGGEGPRMAAEFKEIVGLRG